MRFHSFTGALALYRTVAAFSDSSPWVLLSTSPIAQTRNTAQIQTSFEALRFTKKFLGECPTDRYLIVTQPGITATDFWARDGCAMPHLCKAAKDTRVKGKYSVAEVVGDVTGAGLVEHIKSSCDRKGRTADVVERQLDSLSGDRYQALDRSDASIASDLEMTSSKSYTILFFATPGEPLYDSEFIEPLHMGLKRGFDTAPTIQRANQTRRDTRPLFEKYQFFTPGIFMGLIFALVLLSILGAGLRGLASLEVSYGAFNKEMGPAAHKKQQ